MLHNGSAPSFQVGGAGSIPVIRSKTYPMDGRVAPCKVVVGAYVYSLRKLRNSRADISSRVCLYLVS